MFQLVLFFLVYKNLCIAASAKLFQLNYLAPEEHNSGQKYNSAREIENKLIQAKSERKINFVVG